MSKTVFKLSLNLVFKASSKLELETLINKMFIDQSNLRKDCLPNALNLNYIVRVGLRIGLKGLRMFTF